MKSMFQYLGGLAANRTAGVALMVLTLYVILLASDPNARSWGNQLTIANRVGFYGIFTVGVGVLIISGGIDLSIGSVVALGAVGFIILARNGVHPFAAAGLILLMGSAIGLLNGLLVTKLRLQPFLVTLCGLFVFRGLSRYISPQGSVGLGQLPPTFKPAIESLRYWLFSGTPLGVPQVFVLLLLLAAVMAVLMHLSVYGRYLFAIGCNEQAARYAGIPIDRYKILAYVICSTCAGLGGVVYILDNGTATPTTAGNLLELYAITGAVIGGCSLRGGEGSVLGMLLGATLLPLLKQLIIFGRTANELEYVVIGLALLFGTIVDELLKRRAARKT
jgi:ribose transport system permease protein